MPCRRSRVRVSSSALQNPRKTGFLLSSARLLVDPRHEARVGVVRAGRRCSGRRRRRRSATTQTCAADRGTSCGRSAQCPTRPACRSPPRPAPSPGRRAVGSTSCACRRLRCGSRSRPVRRSSRARSTSPSSSQRAGAPPKTTRRLFGRRGPARRTVNTALPTPLEAPPEGSSHGCRLSRTSRHIRPWEADCNSTTKPRGWTHGTGRVTVPDEPLETGDVPTGPSVPDEATLRSLVDQLPLTVYIDHLDKTTATSTRARASRTSSGTPSKSGRRILDLFVEALHPEDRQRVLDHEAQKLESGEGSRLEYRMVARDGRVRWYLDQFAVVPATARTAGLAHGFLLDITEQKDLENALEQERQRLASILEVSPTPIGRWIPSGRVTSWNTAAEALFGHASDEALDSWLEELVPTTTIDSTMTSKSWVAGPRRARRAPVARCERRDGSVVEVEILRTPLHVEEEGRPRRLPRPHTSAPGGDPLPTPRGGAAPRHIHRRATGLRLSR